MMKKFLLAIFAAALATNVSLADYTVPGVMNGRTVDLWQMESIVRNAGSSRLQGESGDNALWFMLKDSDGNDSGTSAPEPWIGELIDGPAPAFGNAISFGANTGLADAAKPNIWARTRVAGAWGNWEYVKVEMWVKYSELGKLQFVAMTDSWRIWTQGTTIRFTAYFSDSTNSGNRDVGIADYVDEWLYVTAIFDQDGYQELSVKNIDGSFNQSATAGFPGKKLKTTNGHITLASENGARRSFGGAIDSLRISRPDVELEFESLREDTAVGTFALWHLDEQSGNITPDDNSMDVSGRDLPLELKGGAALVTPSEYPAGNADFDKCAEFNGMGGNAASVGTPPFDTSLFNMEFWMKMNPGFIPGETQQVTGPKWIADLGNSFRIYLQVGEATISLRFMVEGTTYQLNREIAIDGKWNHYKLSFDNGEMAMYENGGLLGTATAAITSVPNPAGNLTIGSYGNDRYFWGWLDEIRIYGNTNAQCGDFGYLSADINEDCYVNIQDLKLLVADWLNCTFEGDPNCENIN